jgi:hypothetical protein
MTHMIRRQFLHVEMDGTEFDGLALQRSLPDLCARTLAPAVERALDRCAPPEGHLSIERVDIDAGALPLDRLEHDLAGRVAQALEQTIREQLQETTGTTTRTTVREPSREPPHTQTPGADNIRYTTAQQNLTEVLAYFLETGTLPWSFRVPPGRTLEQVLLDAWQATPPAAVDAPAAGTVLRALAGATARRRLVLQFSVNFVRALAAWLWPAGAARAGELFAALHDHGVDVPATAAVAFERGAWEAVFAVLAVGTGVGDIAALATIAWRGLPAAFAHPALARSLERRWPGVTGSVAGGVAAGVDSGMTGSVAGGVADRVAPLPAHTQMPEARPEGDASRLDRVLDVSEGVYIHDAGLVLLHPFLQRFFEGLGIAADGRLLQPERALCLLHFLALGQGGAREYELSLPKILCGVPLEAAVQTDFELTAAEREEATALLEAVVRHWDALRNTGVDALRGTFLVRPGKLSLREDGDWLLQVEPAGFDVLLDQLPWSSAMIKLPWMAALLRVEWR